MNFRGSIRKCGADAGALSQEFLAVEDVEAAGEATDGGKWSGNKAEGKENQLF